jgi:hypothetical protein
MATADIQEKIAAARREAEMLKEKIRAKRDQLADSSRESLVLQTVCWFAPKTVRTVVCPLDRLL